VNADINYIDAHPQISAFERKVRHRVANLGHARLIATRIGAYRSRCAIAVRVHTGGSRAPKGTRQAGKQKDPRTWEARVRTYAARVRLAPETKARDQARQAVPAHCSLRPAARCLARSNAGSIDKEFTLPHRHMEDLYGTDPPHPYRVEMRVRREEWLAAVFEERIDPTTGTPWLELTYAHPDLLRWDMWVIHRDAYQSWYEDSLEEGFLISNLIVYPPGFLFTPTPEVQK
jgi:hypothetical protein